MHEDLFYLGVKVLIKNNKGQFLLLKVNKELLKHHTDYPNINWWDIPGGRIKEGCTIEKTLHRELKEEIGLTIFTSIMPLTMLLTSVRMPTKDKKNRGLVLSLYSCCIAEDAEIKLSEEHSGFDWCSAQEAEKRLSILNIPKAFYDK
jgi:8-oxo-dGTP pyrophosphatase MutT (NUDIX family)